MNILETLQRIAATSQRLDVALEQVDRERAERQRFEDAVIARLQPFEALMGDLRERLTRLETSREADRAQMGAEPSRFKAEVERAELRLARLVPPHGEPPALPDAEEERGRGSHQP